MSLPWMKMWLEALDDSKLTRLSLAERGAWWGLLKLTHRCNAGGKLISGGQGLDMDEIADALHIKNGEDRTALESMIKKMEARKSLVWNEDVLFVVNYEKRQSVPPSARPEAVAERVRNYRERKRKARDEPELERQNIFTQVYRIRKKKFGRDLDGLEIQAIYLDIDAAIEEGKTASEIIAEERP